MKRIADVTWIGVVFALLFTAPAQAQQPRQGPPAARADTMPMMGSQMMGMMPQQPMHRLGMMAYALPAFADTLGLSPEQRDTLEARKQQLTERQQAHWQAMQARQQQLQSLFEGDTPPDPAAVREQMQALADMRVEMQAARYETAMQMRDVLTDDQQQALDQMDPRAMHRQMMANMTVMEMAQMMRGMYGTGRMGSGRGMMQQDRPMRHAPMPRRRMPRNQQ